MQTLTPHKVRTLNHIAVEGLQVFPRDRYEVGGEITDPDAILLRSHNMHDMPIPASVAVVGRAGAGVNNIPVEALSERGVPVFNAPGANANAVKELVIAGMLLAARNICDAWAACRRLDERGKALNAAVEAMKKQYAGIELPGRTLGVVGLGAIGVRVANAAHALGMNVVGYDPHMTVEGAWQLTADVAKAATLDSLYAESDFVTFHLPLNDATRNILGAARIPGLKAGATVLNFARGGIVDDEALLLALNDGRVARYVTDFPSASLLDHPQVICLPHLGASTAEAERNCAVQVARQVRNYLESGDVLHSVNFPTTRLPRRGATRICLCNTNMPNMIGQMSNLLGEAGANILHMRNESRGELAYNLVDVESTLDTQVVERLRGIEGVRSVRVLQ